MTKKRTEFTNGMLDELLYNPEADAALAKAAIEDAVARGMSVADATKIYGIPDEPELGISEMNRLLRDAMAGRPPSIEGELAKGLYENFVRDVATAKKNGWVISLVPE